jgi:DNA mismatch endonuclease, patch repair protein
MADIVSKEVRSKMMSGIRGKNTKPELLVRHGLFAMGFRYRLHKKILPGKPDLVLPKYRTVLFINGCFWHGHDCELFRIPASNREFWKKKIAGNQANDARNHALLQQAGWTVISVWECAMKGKGRLEIPALIGKIAGIIRDGSGKEFYDIPHPRRGILDS